MISSVILLFFFALSIAAATFIENKHGTEVARELIYNALWFEILLLLMVINLIGNVFLYQIVNLKKLTVLLFHLGFIVIIAGAFITRYFGSEGLMHIREGDTTNQISSNKTSLQVNAELNGTQLKKTYEVEFGENRKNSFSTFFDLANRKINVECVAFRKNVTETIVPDADGEPALSIFIMDAHNVGSDFILKAGESITFENTAFSLHDTIADAHIKFFINNRNDIRFTSHLPILKMGMMEQSQEMILPESVVNAVPKTIYKTADLLFVVKSFLPSARTNIVPLLSNSEKSGIIKKGKNALTFRISTENISKEINMLSLPDETWMPVIVDLEGMKISVAYGFLPQTLPFSIKLNDFVLERYPGSNSPSSYASEITVIDSTRNVTLPYRIFMNNILKYQGYRFFQSSYDEDERGTILSVNNDYWGTTITYVGYFLLIVGMLLTLFNKNSRFRTVLKLSSELKKKRKSLNTIALLIMISTAIYSDAAISTKATHIAKLDQLLIQDAVQGRIEPFNTYASDLFRKIYKGDVYRDMTATEVIINMVLNPDNWQNEAVIKVGNTQLADELGAANGYATFNQFFDFENNGAYRLSEKVDLAYRKNISERNKYDKELLNVDERVNICNEIFSGEIFLILPDRSNPLNRWISPVNFENHEKTCPHADKQTKSDLNIQLNNSDSLSENNIDAKENDSVVTLFHDYLNSLSEAYNIGNWYNADAALLKLGEYQVKFGGVFLPSTKKIKMEILYNRIQIFNFLAKVYLFAGILLLVLFLVDIVNPTSVFEKISRWSNYFYLIVFAIYTLGLVLRWYISGHAPWSNGYETMLFVGWATSFAGLLFSQRTEVTLAVTSILASIALFVAGMSWMNPEITNLVPVLKSYWLIIHVAIITSSYGFLAMGALLGMLNLVLMIIRNRKNSPRLSFSIDEISYVIELALTIGLIMLTAGCFIGGVWANESWGRYWGWDPKETWALVSILIYAGILHLRNVPKANNQFVISSLALVGFSSIIMTFFGVNYYLSGMHSYGSGTPPPLPAALWIILLLVLVVIFMAFKAWKKTTKTPD